MISRGPTLSGLGHVAACPGSLSLPRVERASGPAAALGTAIHELIERRVLGCHGTFTETEEATALAELHGFPSDDEGRLAFLATHLRLPVPTGALAETSLGLFPDGEVRRIEGGAGSYPDVGQILSGQIDILWAEPYPLRMFPAEEYGVPELVECPPGSTCWVVDIKTGDEANVPPVERNWQIRGAALMAARWTGATRVIPAIVFVNAAECAETVRAGRVYEGRWEVGAPLDAVALDGIEVELRTALSAARGYGDGSEQERGVGEPADRSGVVATGTGASRMHEHQPRGAFILGPHCDYCPARAACPAFGAEAVSLARGAGIYADPYPGAALTTEARSYLAGIIPAMRSALVRMEEAVRAGGPVLLADGREYGPALEDVTTFKTRETFDALAAVVGDEKANEAAEYTATSIKRALDGAPRGAFSALMKDVEARGGLVRGTREVWRKRWPAKSAEGASDGRSEVRGDGDGREGNGRGRRPSDPGVRGRGQAVRASGDAGDGAAGGTQPLQVGAAPGDDGVDHGGQAVRGRAICSGCSESFAVTKTGRMWKHLSPGGVFYCGGSGLAPRPSAATLAELVEAERGLT